MNKKGDLEIKKFIEIAITVLGALAVLIIIGGLVYLIMKMVE
jgi:hypothetical protein